MSLTQAIRTVFPKPTRLTTTQNGQSRPTRLNGARTEPQIRFLQSLGLLTGLGAGLASYAFLYEPFDVRLDTVIIRLPRARGRIPEEGLTILHVSDSHFQGHDWRERPKVRRVQELTRHLQPDLLIHTGDFWHKESGLTNVLALLQALPRPRLASFAVLGNHDYTCYDMTKAVARMWRAFQAEERDRRNGHRSPRWRAAVDKADELLRFGKYVMNTPVEGKRTGRNNVSLLYDALERHGFQLLHNRGVDLRQNLGGGRQIALHIAGVDDYVEGEPDLSAALSRAPEDMPTILLSHNPDILQEPELERTDLVLAGHTHGGQIALPFLGALHTQAGHITRNQAAGHMRRERIQLYINQGLGEGIPLRLGVPPQLTWIQLLPED